MERCSKLVYIVLLVGTFISMTDAFPNSTHCEDFSDKCALVQEAKAMGIGLDVIMCNTEAPDNPGEKLAHFCPVTCDICMGK